MATRKDSDGNTINRNGARRASTSPRRDIDVGNETDTFINRSLGMNPLFDALKFFTEHDTGHLKVRRALDSNDLHLTWTWSVGSQRGNYVYARVEYWRLSFGLQLLQSKVLDVEEGIRKATPDKRLP